MTLTLPAPTLRLPHRRRSGRSPAGPVESALADLAAARATGTLYGSAGALHLADGAVVAADSPATPGVEALLTGCGRLTPRQWATQLAACTGSGRTLAEQLVGAGHVSHGELQLCQLTALLDAAYVVLSRSGGEPDFVPGHAPPLVLARPVSVRELRAAVGRRRALLDRVWPSPQVDTAAVRRRPGTVPRGCTRRRQAVLEAADGRRTPAEIALLLGRSAYGTVLDVRHLAARGLVETPAAAVPPQRSAAAPAPPSAPPPQRSAAPPAYDPSDPHVALLLRIRAGLEARL
ncbi:transcriptional regulator [Kitasatospora sp. NBC_00070]|uniref:transcriptional regulator n=1 Tax=Kitasatospora sp. NBC_00070 TaxID=2975962 RepID=UPI0032488FBA